MTKKIYTSNYERHAENPKAIGISLIVPEEWAGTHWRFLAPKGDMVGKLKRGEVNYNQRSYTYNYLDLLSARNVDPKKLIEEIPDGTILLCYEAPGEFCHRRVLADWIERHTGVCVPEWKNESEENQEKSNKRVDSILEF